MAYRKSRAHADDLNRLFQTQEFSCYQLEKIPTMVIINHMKLVENYSSQLGYGRVFNGGIDEHVGLELKRAVRYYAEAFDRVK